MFRLPVSRMEVALRPLTGREELLLLETPCAGTHYAPADAAALVPALLARLARPVEDAMDSMTETAANRATRWSALPVTDLDALLLHLRQACLGDRIRAETFCPSAGCSARMDVTFRIHDYLAHNALQGARGVVMDEAAGWYRFTDAPIRFRIPTGDDLLEAVRQPDPERALILRCACPSPLPARARRRVENALACLSPSLAGTLQGVCPECGANVAIAFEPRQFVLRELREQSAFLYQDIHLLAAEYHWSEAAILALPRVRRIAYTELIRQSRGAA